MSNDCITYVWKTPYKGAQKLMLVCIADQCNDEGFCWPSIATLAKKCGITEANARNMVQELERIGEVGVNEGSSTKRSNIYYMLQYRASIKLANDDLEIRPPRPKRERKKKEEVIADNTIARNTIADNTLLPAIAHDPIARNTQTLLPAIPEPSLNPQSLEPKEKDYPAPESKPVRKQSSHQQAVGALMEAFNVQVLTGPDKTNMGKVAKELLAAGLEPGELKDLVAYVRRMAKQAGGWDVTINSLTTKLRVSDYINWRNKQSAAATIPPATPATLPTASDGVIHLPAPLKPTGTEG